MSKAARLVYNGPCDFCFLELVSKTERKRRAHLKLMFENLDMNLVK